MPFILAKNKDLAVAFCGRILHSTVKKCNAEINAQCQFYRIIEIAAFSKKIQLGEWTRWKWGSYLDPTFLFWFENEGAQLFLIWVIFWISIWKLSWVFRGETDVSLEKISDCPNQPDLPRQLKTHLAFLLFPILDTNLWFHPYLNQILLLFQMYFLMIYKKKWYKELLYELTFTIFILTEK